MISNKTLITHLARFKCFNVVHSDEAIKVSVTLMHSPSARALSDLNLYGLILVHTLKHLNLAKCVITIT